MNKDREILAVLKGFKQCLNVAPLPIISLIIYMGLRGTAIFPNVPEVIPISPQTAPKAELWQSAYYGWYDLLFFFSVSLSFGLGHIKVSRQNLVFILTLALIILLSFVHGLTFGYDFILDALVYFFRFTFAFCLGAWLVKRVGNKATESLVIILFLILAITALFVYWLSYPRFVRVFATGMTTGSFSQVAAVVCFLNFWLKYNLFLIISLVFLLLTFSKTSILLLIGLIVFQWRAKIFKLAKFIFLIALGFVGVFYVLRNIFGQHFFNFLDGYTRLDIVLALSGRTEIWSFAKHLLESGQVPLLGLGFNAASSLIVLNNFYLLWSKFNYLANIIYYYPPTFHSILIEYGFGLGILSIVIFGLILKRIWQTLQHQCQPAFFIFSFFLLCQSIDFAFYRPKEVIIWSLILGLAEGQWRTESEQAY